MRKDSVFYIRFNTREKQEKFLATSNIHTLLRVQEFIHNHPHPIDILEPSYKKNYEALLKKS